MQTTTFDNEIAIVVETATCKAFDCKVGNIVCYADTLVKKVVVFVLLKSYGYDKRILGKKYQMSYLYVPTVVAEIIAKIDREPDFRNKVMSIVKSIEYAEILD